jgi:anti-anti-sigma factor
MRIRTDTIADVAVLRPEGRITIGGSDFALRREFDAAWSRGFRKFLLDLTQVSFTDSSGVGEIVACWTKATKANGALALLLATSGKLREHLKIQTLDQYIPTFYDEAEAIASLH